MSPQLTLLPCPASSALNDHRLLLTETQAIHSPVSSPSVVKSSLGATWASTSRVDDKVAKLELDFNHSFAVDKCVCISVMNPSIVLVRILLNPSKVTESNPFHWKLGMCRIDRSTKTTTIINIIIIVSKSNHQFAKKPKVKARAGWYHTTKKRQWLRVLKALEDNYLSKVCRYRYVL